MATAASRQRAQLFREMNKTRTSSGSSRHSQSPQPTISDIDSNNEASLSTRQIDDLAPKLPELRASAQKYKRHFPAKREPEYYIDTSAIGRAFPDFSQGSIPSEESGMSIEVGRGAPKENNGGDKLNRPKEFSPPANFGFDDTLSFQDVITSSDLFTGGPTFRKQSSVLDHTDTMKADSRNGCEARRTSALRTKIEPSPPEKAKDYGSADSRKSSNGKGRSLADMHARVRDENDMSMLSDQRPPTVELNVRKTRFGNGKSTHDALTHGLPTRFNASQGLQHSNSTEKPSTDLATTPPTTHQFSLPYDAPTMSELLAGVYGDGTPVFSRRGKSRASINAIVQRHDSPRDCANVEDVAVPFDEQAIFLSLKLLEDKVAVLERSKAEAEVVVRDLEEQNARLQAERSGMRRASHRSDSALGTTDSEGGDEITGDGQRKTAIERNRLESSIRSLQARLDMSNRKANTAETILRSITHERDSAVSQLSLAFVTTEHLKVENEAIKEENERIKVENEDIKQRNELIQKENGQFQKRITQLTNQYSNETQQWTAKEAALRHDIQRGTEAAKALSDKKNAIVPSSQSKNIPCTRIGNGPQPSTTALAKNRKPDDDDSLFDLTPRQPKTTREVSRGGESAPGLRDRALGRDTGNEVPKRTSEDRSAVEQGPKNHDGQDQTGNASEDLTYLSFFDTGKIAKLRKTIEGERLALRQRVAARHQNADNPPNMTQERQIQNPTQTTNVSFGRELLANDLTSNSSQTTHQAQSIDEEKATTGNTRRHSETSVLSARSRRRGRNTENMTSAFILPDITIRATDLNTQEVPELTKENQKNLERLAQHGAETCMVCKRSVGFGKRHDHAKRAKSMIKIPKPVPVSQRVPEAASAEEDMTIRPSQPPGLALATVLKGLEDETTHLKIKLSKYQALYNGHDPSLSKRQRKAVHQKIEGLLQAIDGKSDQIYALYDVLEGQKQHGQELTEQQIEVTLQSVGIALNEFDLVEPEVEKASKAVESARHPWELISEAGDADLPWEGIESTVETTKSGFVRASKRRSSTN